MKPDLFQQVIADTLRELPKSVRDKLSQVTIVVENRRPHGDDTDLLGLFEGVPYNEKMGSTQAEADRIIIFRRNLEESCETDEELAQEIRTTLLHEIGHYLGWDEDDLAERGLD